MPRRNHKGKTVYLVELIYGRYYCARRYEDLYWSLNDAGEWFLLPKDHIVSVQKLDRAWGHNTRVTNYD